MALLLVSLALLSLLHSHLPLPTFAKHLCSACRGPEPRLVAWIYTETNGACPCSLGAHPAASPPLSLLHLELWALGVLPKTFPSFSSPLCTRPFRKTFFPHGFDHKTIFPVLFSYLQYWIFSCFPPESVCPWANQVLTKHSPFLSGSAQVSFFPPKTPKSGSHHRSHSPLSSVSGNQCSGSSDLLVDCFFLHLSHCIRSAWSWWAHSGPNPPNELCTSKPTSPSLNSILWMSLSLCGRDDVLLF